jgi:hypothetical protein
LTAYFCLLLGLLMATQKFTDKWLQGLKPPTKGQVLYWDKMLPGFGVLIGKTGRKSFFVGTWASGKYHRRTLKPPYPFLSLADARLKAGRVVADLQVGITPAIRKKREERNTFGGVAAAFMEDHAKDLRTRDEYQRKIDVDLDEWRDRPIADITRTDIKELIRIKARTAPISANRLLALISVIFSWAVEEELVTASPALKMRSRRCGQSSMASATPGGISLRCCL